MPLSMLTAEHVHGGFAHKCRRWIIPSSAKTGNAPMPSRKPFLPPRVNPLILSCAKTALPMMFHLYAGGIDVDISNEDLARLRALKRQRLLLVPNHPTHFDPMIMI